MSNASDTPTGDIPVITSDGTQLGEFVRMIAPDGSIIFIRKATFDYPILSGFIHGNFPIPRYSLIIVPDGAIIQVVDMETWHRQLEVHVRRNQRE